MQLFLQIFVEIIFTGLIFKEVLLASDLNVWCQTHAKFQ